MKLLVINGPNINLLGKREPEIYGSDTYGDLIALIERTGKEFNVEVSHFQSNHEGAIIDCIQSAYGNYDGIVINPAAYTHTSIAIMDAIKAVGLPCIEVHLSDISKRETFRQFSYISMVCDKTVKGLGIEGYRVAIAHLVEHYKK